MSNPTPTARRRDRPLADKVAIVGATIPIDAGKLARGA